MDLGKEDGGQETLAPGENKRVHGKSTGELYSLKLGNSACQVSPTGENGLT